MNTKRESLMYVLSKMLNINIQNADYQAKHLHGGTLGNVQLITGKAELLTVKKSHIMLF